MIRIRQGNVAEIISRSRGITEIKVDIEGKLEKAVNYDFMTGPVNVGDVVSLNTTAVHMGLGSGGNHFVMANFSINSFDPPQSGHIMKLRYTPNQVKCFSVEEELHPGRSKIQEFKTLNKLPVIIGTLHSMLAPAAAGVKAVRDKLRVVYVMTDGAALPLNLSRTVAELKEKGLIDTAVTAGHAFGGDLEAVNIYTGLIAAAEVARADVIIVTMGPGIVGTGTKYGFTGIEQGEIINAVNILGGRPIAIPRISFADKRERHRGISHHTITAVSQIALTPCKLVVPYMEQVKEKLIKEQLNKAGIPLTHEIVKEDGVPALDYLAEKNIAVTTMGRAISQDREFFLAAGAAGITGAKLANH